MCHARHMPNIPVLLLWLASTTDLPMLETRIVFTLLLLSSTEFEPDQKFTHAGHTPWRT